MKSYTSIPTTESKRIAKRLLNHWKHKFEVSESDTDFIIFMPEAKVILTSQEQALNVNLDTQQPDNTRLEQVVIDHLNRMAQQEFIVEWQHSA